MDTVNETLLYRSEAFAEDVFDLVAARPEAVQAPAVPLGDPLRRAMRTAAVLLSPPPAANGLT